MVPCGLLIRTRPLPQTGTGGKNDHVVDQSGPTYRRRVGLSAFIPSPPHSLFRGLLDELQDLHETLTRIIRVG